MEHLIDLDKKGHSSTMMQRLNGFRTNHQHCDFKVKVDCEEIPAHRNVLAAGSDYFNAMLSHDTLENQSGVVEIKEADAESVRKCIGFIYTGKISVAEGKYEQLMHVAHLFQLQPLCDEIAVFLEASLDVKSISFFVTKKLANMYNCKKLEERCDQFALEKMREVSDQNEFVQLDSSYITSMMKSRVSATVKLRSLIKWAKYDIAARREARLFNFKRLDLSSVTMKYRKFVLEHEPVVSGDAECLKLLILPVFQNVEAGDVESEEECDEASPTRIVVFNKGSGFLQSFDLVKKTWEQMQKIKDGMNLFSAVRLGNRVFILMGRSFHQLEYSNMKAEWEQLPDMLEDHGQAPPVAIFLGCIFVVGGGHPIYTTSVEKYNPSMKKWKKSPDKIVDCSYSTPFGSRDHLYSIGGYKECTDVNTVERFDPLASSWSYVAPMKYARRCPAVAELEDKIYVMGGCGPATRVRQDLSVVEYFTPQTNAWTTVASMNVPRYGFRALVLANSIFVVGNSGTTTAEIEKYSQEDDKWEVVGKCESANIENYASFPI